jgi:ATP-binding cassette subfamily B protein
VDTYTEEKILGELTKIMNNRTTILVSHRISTVKSAHQIVVLKNGSIVERGTHESLMAMQGVYAELYRKQLLEEELELEGSPFPVPRSPLDSVDDPAAGVQKD